MNEEDVVYLYNGTLHSHKKEWNHAICNNMDGPRDYHTKWSKLDKDKITLYHLYVESKKIIQKTKMNCIQNKNRPMNIENKLMGTKGEKERER